MITLQARQADGTWSTRNAFSDDNKLVACGQMLRAELITKAEAVARAWHARTNSDLVLRVHDTDACVATAEDTTPASRSDTSQFVVSADHVSPRFRFNNHPARARKDAHYGTWYAVSEGLGCSKNYATARDAVLSLFADNACTNVRIY